MPAELVLRLCGGVNNTDPALSVGGETSAWPVDLADVFPDVPLRETSRGAVLYRALDLLNVGDQGAHGIRAWLTPGDSVELGVSGVADVRLSPSGPYDHGHLVSFARYSKAAPLALADLVCGGTRRLWFKRTIPRGSRGGIDSETLHLRYR